ncbi:hypothetical protein LCGC14_1942840 [marine sediment metagenome]|uniref:Uncharacterized protein n=1 Tax=marine sediment metagenome TaxID=412755 RepID=A0A0F9G8C4_9ZZZZ
MANLNISFPFEGIDKGKATSNQSPTTSPDMNNMRVYDTLDNRARGGQRFGFEKWGDGALIGGDSQPIVAICAVSSVI